MTKREAAHTSALLWATAKQEPVYVLEKGRPAYRIEYIGDTAPDPLAELERRGLLTRAAASPPPIPVAGPARYTTEQVERLVDEMRADR